MAEYAISIFWSEEDGEYVAIVPDLEGCSASGATPEEALREVQIAKDMWLDVARERRHEIPEPRWRPDGAARAG